MNFIKKIIKKNELYDLLAVRRIRKKLEKKRQKILDVEKYEIEKYFEYYGLYPNLENPKKFSEFLLWQKLFFRDERATIMTDKILCKDFFKKRIGEDLNFTKILNIYNNANEIDLKYLPDEFILKCNHNSGYIFHIKRIKNNKWSIKNLKDKTFKKYSIAVMKAVLDQLLKTNYYYSSFEWNYKNIVPRIFAEEFLDTSELQEYKLYMNDGKLLAFHITSNRQTDERNDYFDSDFQPMNVWADVPPSDVLPKPPDSMSRMIEIAQKISTGFPILRVDFYISKGKIFFGEATFFHMGGYLEFKYPENLDEILGKNAVLSKSFKKTPENI